MNGKTICRLCLNWINSQYVSIDSNMLEKFQALCPDVKTTLLEDSVICPSCMDLLQKFDHLRNKYKKTKETCKVCGVNLVDQNYVTSTDTLQMCEDMGFSVPIDSKVCDECINTMYEVNTFRAALNNTQNGNIFHCDKSTIEDEVELGPVELLQFHSNLLDELNECLEINTTKKERESSCEKSNDINKNDKPLYGSSEHQDLGSPCCSSFEDDIEMHSGSSNNSIQENTEEHSEQDDGFQRKVKMPKNSVDSNEMKTLGSQKCSFKSRNKGAVEAHSLVHKKPLFECHICKHKTRLKANLKRHLLIHKNPEDVDMFKCQICKYETKQKVHLKTHLLIHKKPEDVEMFKCQICKYETKYKVNLKTHLLIHEKPENVKLFECNICKYTFTQKRSLKRHLLIHKEPENVNMFECHVCEYKSIQKGTLKTHLLIHKKPEDIEMFECHICEYKTKRKGVLKGHFLIHNKPEDVEMFVCHICKHKTKRKDALKKHLLIHKNSKDIEMFECYICKYETKRKYDLRKHLQTHDSSW